MISKLRSTICLAVFGLGIILSSRAAAQPITHQVQEGETLWSISEKYYGTPDVWPKLWEMNPFITNPHLLKPGDVIRISDGQLKPTKGTAASPPLPASPKPFVAPVVKTTGIQIEKLAKLDARGFLSPEKETPLGVVYTSDSSKILLSKGDQLFLDFQSNEGMQTGDSYLICRLQPLPVTHIVTHDHVGYMYTARAKVVLRERTVKNIFRAEILANYYQEVLQGDLVFPLNPVPGCMKPLPSDAALRGVVVGTQGRGNAFGRNSLVYLDCGRDDGLFPGMLLELIRFKNVPDRDFPLEFGALFLEQFKVKTFAELLDKIYRESPIYEKMIGRMIVVDSGPETATALVLNANETLQLGTFFRGVSSWTEPPGSRQFKPSCPLD